MGVYPPSFCNWRLLLTVVVITELSVVLVGLGRGGLPGWQWLGMATIYSQWMALFCASGLCVTNGWTSRLSARGAWIGSWLIAISLSTIYSYAGWLAVFVFMPGMISDSVGMFVLKSVFAVGLVAVIFFRYLEIRARWRLELMAQAEARVQALQARIRPHFLFNSLNTIASLIPDDPASAEAATLDLADIFRGSMRRADQLISLSDELKLAHQYLDMERRRLGERLDVDWRVDELPAAAAVLRTAPHHADAGSQVRFAVGTQHLQYPVAVAHLDALDGSVGHHVDVELGLGVGALYDVAHHHLAHR